MGDIFQRWFPTDSFFVRAEALWLPLPSLALKFFFQFAVISYFCIKTVRSLFSTCFRILMAAIIDFDFGELFTTFAFLAQAGFTHYTGVILTYKIEIRI